MRTILSMDGGGCKILRTLRVLRYIEQRTGKPCREIFDVIAGTSAGGICALALTKEQPLSAGTLTSLLLKLCTECFEASAWHKIRTLGGLAGPKYDANGLRAVLEPVFGKELVGDKALVTTFRMEDATPIEIWGPDKDWYALDAALATSAAPTYFAPHIRQGIAYWDGGVAVNNPALAALAYVPGGADEAAVLSIGTGAAKEGWQAHDVASWNTLQIVQPVLSAGMDGGALQAHETLARLLPPERYARVQATYPNGAMDDVSPKNIGQLLKDGDSLLAAFKPQIDAFLDRRTRA